MRESLQVPLFPLPNVVHFPQTELRLHIFEPRYRQLIADLQRLPPAQQLIGMVVLVPGVEERRPAIFSAGTAGRVLEVAPLADGRFDILLHGAFRFEVRAEVDPAEEPPTPYRRALVQPVDEPRLDERSPDVRSRRQVILRTAYGLSHELPDRFPLSVVELRELDRKPLEPLVNGLCARLDLPVLRKIELLSLDLPDRTATLQRVLESRRQVLEDLRRFRHLDANPELN
ncbi:MAG TPA: LON peptidase substrate-binding domain-containing protein [Thermoanaerobaculia bacterium]|nr:LON peptidase substrate-binding domain-containing protein [Thermoanaerobaculia bacterium]